MSTLFPVVILAGGLATRLRPVTETLPKSLISIHGEPFICHQLKLLKSQGVKEVIICLGYLGDMIESLIGDGKKFSMDIRYSYDGNQLLGTAGAIKKAYNLLPEYFFVLYGDSYLVCDYQQVQSAFINSHQQALMTVLHNQNNWDKSNVLFNAGQILKYDKKIMTTDMQHIDYGLGIFNKAVFSTVAKDTFYDLATVYQNLLLQHELAGFLVTERFYEVGSFNGIRELENLLAI